MWTMYETLARDRMREAQEHAAQSRLRNRLHSQARWHRLATLAGRHERQAAQRLADARSSYTLIG
jgi:hypothetical protein